MTKAKVNPVVAFVGPGVRGAQDRQLGPSANGQQHQATIIAMKGIAPRDELENRLAAQVVAPHNATCARRGLGSVSRQGSCDSLYHCCTKPRVA